MLINKHDIVKSIKALDGITYDVAIPQTWFNAVSNKIVLGDNENLAAHFVWVYPDKSIFGYPYPIDDRGVQILGLISVGIQ